ncbi:MAG TPA: hypothetical protein VF469_30155 [Kofleriaceae bacterium]
MHISIDDAGITRVFSDGRREVVPWDSIALVALVWTPKADRNPLSEVGYWELHATNETRSPIPFRAAARDRLTERLARLPGFPAEDAARTAAGTRADEGYLVVWQRPTWRCRVCGQADVVRQDQSAALPWDAVLACPVCHTAVHLGRQRGPDCTGTH